MEQIKVVIIGTQKWLAYPYPTTSTLRNVTIISKKKNVQLLL